jgi:hypothetical protein
MAPQAIGREKSELRLVFQQFKPDISRLKGEHIFPQYGKAGKLPHANGHSGQGRSLNKASS